MMRPEVARAEGCLKWGKGKRGVRGGGGERWAGSEERGGMARWLRSFGAFRCEAHPKLPGEALARMRRVPRGMQSAPLGGLDGRPTGDVVHVRGTGIDARRGLGLRTPDARGFGDGRDVGVEAVGALGWGRDAGHGDGLGLPT